jgi:hypothetical protein
MEQELTAKEVRGLKHFKQLLPLLDRLHHVGCERDTAGNRKFFFDDYVKLMLLYMWNPLIGSMRALQKAITFGKVFKALGIRPFSLGSFSEAPAVFEPERLKTVIEELAGELRPLAADPRLSQIKDALTLVDGTVLAGLTGLANAAVNNTCYNTTRDGRQMHGWRVHTQLDLKTFTPSRLSVTGACNAGEQRENNVLKKSLEAGHCYVGDCTYSDRRLLDDIVEHSSSYVMRLPESNTFQVIQERELSQEDLDAGVVRDAIVRLEKPGEPEMNHTVRIVELQVQPRPRRTRKARAGVIKGSRHSDRLVLVTCLVFLSPWLVGLIYQKRYSVELFFRFFKQILGMRHLLSQRARGVEIQVYCAVIACLIIQLQTGRKPDKRTVEVMGYFFMGLASEQEVIDHLNKPDRTGVKLRAKEALWKKLGY